jgi:hypothetical protein
MRKHPRRTTLHVGRLLTNSVFSFRRLVCLITTLSRINECISADIGMFLCHADEGLHINDI